MKLLASSLGAAEGAEAGGRAERPYPRVACGSKEGADTQLLIKQTEKAVRFQNYVNEAATQGGFQQPLAVWRSLWAV